MRARLRNLLLAGAVALGLGAAGLAIAPPVAQEAETTVLGGLISRALSTPAQRISIGAIDGALSSDATIRDVVIADREGPWLRLDEARLVWSRLALLRGRLEINRLEIGRLEILRRPIPAEEAVPAADQPILPELPVKVVVSEFALRDLVLAEPLLGTQARVSAKGNASLGAPAEGLSLALDARRTDAQGTLTARLSLVPKTQALALALNLTEPEGGILARAADLPGLPPVSLDLGGDGTLDDFLARLVFRAGDTIGADGTGRLRREGDLRRLALDLDARIEGLLPAIAAPVFAGTTQLDGSIAFRDAGGIDIAGVSVASQVARLDLSGGVSANTDLDLRIGVRALPTEGGRTRAGDVAIGRLVLDATVNGPSTGPSIAASLDLADAALPAGRIGRATASFTAKPNGLVTEPGTRIALAGDADVMGLALTDPALARALGDELALTLRGTAGTDGVADIETLRVSAGTLEAGFRGEAGGARLKGRLALNAPDLARLGGVAGLALRGRLAGNVDLAGVPREGRIEALTDLDATGLSTGIAALDGITGGRLAIDGSVLTLPAGGYGFRDLRLAGAHVAARLDGTATAGAAGIDLTANLPDLRRLDGRLTGRGTLTGRLTGTVARPDATARIELADATALGRPVPRLLLSADATDLTGALDARLTLDGSVGGKPARGGLRLSRIGADGWNLSDVDVSVGSASARGNVALDGQGRAQGDLAISARDLDDIAPLALTPMGGDIDARLVLSRPEVRQDVALTAQGNAIRVGEARVERLRADLRGTALYTRPGIAGTLEIDRARISGEDITRVRFDAKEAADGSALTLAASLRGFDLTGQGLLVPGEETRLDLAKLEARRGARRIALAQPGAIAWRDGTLALRRIVLAIESGRLAIDGTVGSSLDLTVDARAIPLSAAEIVQPGLSLSGTLEASAKLAGTGAAPRGDWRLRVARLVAPQTRANGLPPIDVQASGTLADARSSLDATLMLGGANSMRLTGSVPLDARGALDLAARGRLDLALANPMLAVGGRRATGTASIDARIAGTLAAPRAEGGATIASGTFTDAEQGVRLTAIAGRIDARGDRLVIERLNAATPGGGTLALSGDIGLDPGAGFPGRLRIAGNRAQLVSSALATAVANLDLDLSGPLARQPTIGGRVEFVSLDVRIPERLAATVRPLEKVRHIAPPPHVAAKLAREARARASAGRGPAFNAVLDLVVSAPNRVFVRGRGIEAELGGDLRLTGSLASPVPIGAFDLRRGRLQIGGQRLDLTRGRLAFGGTLAPELDFVAETQAGDVVARIEVTGAANEPSFAFTSDPFLPADEVLSRLLFEKASGGLSPGQALQLAQVAAQFSGAGGDGVFEQLRRSLGVDSLDISLGADGSPAVGISRAISDRVSVGVKAGSTPEQSGLSVDVDVTRRIRLQGEVTGDGGTSVGVGAEWEY